MKHHAFVRLFLSSSLMLIAALAQAEVRPIAHRDLWLMPRVGSPAVSPDGRYVVFQVTEPAYDSNEQVSDLWLVPSDGSAEPRRLTQNKAAETGANWSADSRRIAFSTKREGDAANQIYVIDVVAGGEAQRATSLSTGARLPKFSPDGTKIAFTSDVHRDSRNDADSKRIAEEETARKYKVRAYTSFPIRNWDKWLPDRQARVFVQTIGKGDAKDLLAGSSLVQQPGYAGRTTQGGNELDVVWTPDGKSVVFSASRNSNRAAYGFTNAELWQVASDGGEPRRITGSDALDGNDNYSEPQFSADGRTLYSLVEPRTKRVYNAVRVVAIDWPTGKERARIVPAGAREAIGFAVAPNNRDVYLLAEDAGHVKVFRGNSRGGEATVAYDLSAGMYDNLTISSANGRPTLIARYESAVTPSEIVRIDVQRGRHDKLTQFTSDAVAQLDLAPVEHFWFDSTRGARIHNMLVRPAGFDPAKKYPLLVLMHGGPNTMWRDTYFLRWNYHLIAASGYVVLLTNYTGSTGFGEAFAQGIEGDPFVGPANEINQAADVAIAKYGFIDGTRQCAGGASYGGHLANWLQASTDRYRCLISHAGLINLEDQWGTSDIAFSREATLGGPPWERADVWSAQNPIRHAAKWRTPVLVTVGEKDFRVPMNNTLEYWTALQRQKIESRLLIFPDENHWILQGDNSRYFYDEVQQWLGRWLRADTE